MGQCFLTEARVQRGSLLLVLIALQAEGQDVAVSGFVVEPAVLWLGWRDFHPSLSSGMEQLPVQRGVSRILLNSGLAAASLLPQGLF